MSGDFDYDVALSFAGEDRAYVTRVAAALAEGGVSVFFDAFEEVELWGKDLYGYLDDVYQNRARYCVMFISKAYGDKLWTNHERKSAQARAFREHEEYILPCRFDETEIPGVRPTVGYLNLSGLTPEDLAARVQKKLVAEGRTVEPTTAGFRRPAVAGGTLNAHREALSFIDWLMGELEHRCATLADRGIECVRFDRGGRSCLRVSHNGETRFSFEVGMGGIGGDSALEFYGIPGESHGFGNQSNAFGRIGPGADAPIVELQDFSLFGILEPGEKAYSFSAFRDALWDRVCEAIEQGSQR